MGDESISLSLTNDDEGNAVTQELSDVIQRHRNKIVEDILTLHCPACGQAFLDFSNWFALWCCSCNTAFCAYCQKNCRSENNDAHNHVSRCKYNIAPNKSLFAPFLLLRRAQNLRRVREIQAYISSIDDREM